MKDSAGFSASVPADAQSLLVSQTALLRIKATYIIDPYNGSAQQQFVDLSSNTGNSAIFAVALS